MSAVERLRQSPLRYAIPNGMTLSRPILEHKALEAYEEGKKWKALFLHILAGVTDMDGRAARKLNATSSFGEAADAVGDRIMIAEFIMKVDMDEQAKKVIVASEGAIGLMSLALMLKGEKLKVSTVGKARMVTHVVGSGALISPLGENGKINKDASRIMAGASVAAVADYTIQAAAKVLKK